MSRSLESSLSSISVADFCMRLFAALCVFLDCLLWALGIESLEPLAVIAIAALSIALCVKTRANTLLFLLAILIAYANYSALIANYSSAYAAKSSYETMYQGTWIVTESTCILLLFMASLVLFFPTHVRESRLGDFFGRYKGSYSLPLVAADIALLIMIFVTCSSGFKDTGGRGEANQLFEYAYIFFIVGFYLAGKSKELQRALIAVAVLYILANVLGG